MIAELYICDNNICENEATTRNLDDNWIELINRRLKSPDRYWHFCCANCLKIKLPELVLG